MKVTLFLLAALISYCSAHMCLIYPLQRGSAVDLDKQGANDCILLDMPCGKRPTGPPRSILMSGQKNEFVFQKNLDHFYKASPGNFSLWINATDSSGTKHSISLATVTDSDTPSGHLYIAMIDIPAGAESWTKPVVWAAYFTNNPNAPPVFYQCADVMIMKPSHRFSGKLRA